MAIITLLTDFGLHDEYVGVMKGSILSVNSSVTIVDITHDIDPYDIAFAALIIEYSHSYFPKGTVHVTVVDPGVGGDRSIIAFKRQNHVFIGPNNGVLSFLCDDQLDSDVHEVVNERLFRYPLSRTFHGRDVMGPVAAYLSSGMPLPDIGGVVPKKMIKRLKSSRAIFDRKKKRIDGKILSFDRFGNILTNIHQSLLNDFDPFIEAVIHIGGKEITGILSSYQSAGHKKPLAIVGSRKFIEISVCSGSAKNYFSVKKNDPIIITVV